MEYIKKQVEYFALNNLVKPELSKFKRKFQNANQNDKNSLLKITCDVSLNHLEIPEFKDLDIEQLQTKIKCDACKTEFSVFGNFANCPICNNMSAFNSYRNSINITNKIFLLFDKENLKKEVRREIYSGSIDKCISHFDSLGKELRKKKSEIFPDKPKNLFQNLYLLDSKINQYISKNHDNFEALLKMFQVRHVYTHNSGVIDTDFVQKVPDYTSDIDKIYEITKEEIESFIINMQELGSIIERFYNQHN
jgi:hypothetical protein